MQEKFTFDELLALVPTIPWFEQSGYFPPHQGVYAVSSLEPSVISSEVGEEWTWLPTGYSETDPFLNVHGDLTAEQNNTDALRTGRVAIQKTLLAAFRGMPETMDWFVLDNTANLPTKTVVSPEEKADVLPAAQSSALYAFRMAATEALTDRCDPWCYLVSLYAQGVWPCGLTESGKIIVY